MTKEEAIQRIINDGVAIANKIKAAKTVKEIEALNDSLENYEDLFDNCFKTEDDDFIMMAFMAAEGKIGQIEYYPGQEENGNKSADDFLDSLLSEYWANFKFHGDKYELIIKLIDDGKIIADKLRNTKTAKEVEALAQQIEDYINLVNDNFGEESPISGKKENYLSKALQEAKEEKLKQLKNYPEQNEDGNIPTDYFYNYLLSRNWIDNENGVD